MVFSIQHMRGFKMSVKYTDPTKVEAIYQTLDVPLSRSASGYGSKLPTSMMIDYRNARGHLRHLRVYVVNYSNCGSAYVHVDKQDLYLDIDTEYAYQGVMPKHML